jgi:hypothetical protein
MATKPQHQAMLDYIYNVLDALDKSGANTDNYREYYSNMNEQQFKEAMKEFLLDEKENFYIELDAFDNNLTIEEIDAAGKVANVLLSDYLVLPHISEDKDNPYVSNEKVMLGWIPQRRVQQSLSVKNHLSVAIDKRNPKTGQVIDEDKNSRISDSEMYQLLFQNSPNVLAEFFGPKSDDMLMKNEMLYQIQRKGSVSLDELPSSPENKVSLNYLNFLLLAAGYESDLINANGLLPIVASRGGKLYPD